LWPFWIFSVAVLVRLVAVLAVAVLVCGRFGRNSRETVMLRWTDRSDVRRTTLSTLCGINKCLNDVFKFQTHRLNELIPSMTDRTVATIAQAFKIYSIVRVSSLFLKRIYT